MMILSILTMIKVRMMTILLSGKRTFIFAGRSSLAAYSFPVYLQSRKPSKIYQSIKISSKEQSKGSLLRIVMLRMSFSLVLVVQAHLLTVRQLSQLRMMMLTEAIFLRCPTWVISLNPSSSVVNS